MEWLANLNVDPGLLDARLFDLAGTPITVATVIVFLMILALTFLASHVAQRAVGRAMRRRKVTDEGTIALARRLCSYLIWAIGVGVGLQTIQRVS